eukprot:9742821-Ditylum_brightwellii.AAC.2
MNEFEFTSPTNSMREHLDKECLYLGVTMLADISTDNAKYICAWALMVSGRACPTMPWPNQKFPPARSWVVWCQYLYTHFAFELPKNSRLSKYWKLDTELGDWTTTHLLLYCTHYYD